MIKSSPGWPRPTWSRPAELGWHTGRVTEPRLRTPALLVLVAAVITTAACGKGSSAPTGPPAGPPLQVVQSAAVRTAAVGTARASLSMTTDLSGLPAAVPTGLFAVSATGAFDLAVKRSRIDLDLSRLPAGMRARLRGTHLVMLVDQGTIYVSAASLGIASAKPWVRLDATNLGAGSFDPSQLAQFAPGQGLDLLKQLGDVTFAGHEQVRGEPTTHYHASLDLGRVLNALGPAGSEVNLFGGPTGSTPVPIDVWVDPAGRLRRMTLALDLLPLLRGLLGAFTGTSATGATTLPGNARARIDLSFELYDFGAKVDVAPPPADQVAPAPAGFSLFHH
jgi:hypothetical protein